MNERIKQLAKQAWEYAQTSDRWHAKTRTEMYDEKFTELIIRECMLQVADVRIENDFEPVADASLVKAMQNIRNFFGVEE